MGLFQKKPIELRQNMPYTINIATKSKLIIGLGNPGIKHKNTRHNVGFMALDRFAEDNDFDDWQDNKRFKGLITEKTLGATRAILLKPTTFMNLSGESARSVFDFYKLNLDEIVVVYDELAIPFGQIRNRIGGSDAGHNGVKSLIEHLSADFGRIRIGIKNNISAKADASDFVLNRFDKSEATVLPNILSEVSSILTEYIYGNTLPTDTRKVDIKK